MLTLETSETVGPDCAASPAVDVACPDDGDVDAPESPLLPLVVPLTTGEDCAGVVETGLELITGAVAVALTQCPSKIV